MKKCICGADASYLCRPCLVAVCKNHKVVHQERKNRDHTFETLKKHLSTQQIKKVAENLSSKIKVLIESKNQILKESSKILEKITSMCLQTLQKIKSKQQRYFHLFSLCHKKLLTSKTMEIENELKISLVSKIPAYELKEIERFYEFDHLKEYAVSEYIASMPVEAAKNLLIEDYGLYLEGHIGSVRSLAITSDNKYIVSGGNDKAVRIWNLQDKMQEGVLYGHTHYITSIVISTCDRFIASSSMDKSVRMWDLQAKTQIHIFYNNSFSLTCVTITTDNKYIVWADANSTMSIVCIQSQEISKYREESSKITCIAITSDNKFIVSGRDDKTVRLWNLTDKTLEATLNGHFGIVLSLAISKDNKYILSGSKDKTVIIWSPQSKTILDVLSGHTNRVSSVAITSDNQYIVSGSWDLTIIIWDFQDNKNYGIVRPFRETAKKIAILQCFTTVRSIAITSDDKFIVSGGGDNTVKIWSIIDKREETILAGHTGSVMSLAITRHNRYIISGGADNKVRIWNLQDRTQEAVLHGHTSSVKYLAMTNDNKYIVSGGSDKSVRIWNVRDKIKDTDFVHSHWSLNRI